MRERRDNITLGLFRSKLNEIHLDSKASQVITGGDLFFFFPEIGFWLCAVKHENLWVRILFSCVKKAADGEGGGGEVCKRHFIMMFWFISLVFGDQHLLFASKTAVEWWTDTFVPSWWSRSVVLNWFQAYKNPIKTSSANSHLGRKPPAEERLSLDHVHCDCTEGDSPSHPKNCNLIKIAAQQLTEAAWKHRSGLDCLLVLTEQEVEKVTLGQLDQ